MSFRAQPWMATSGIVFNRKDPRDANGNPLPLLNRMGEVKEGHHNYLIDKGKDFTSIGDRHKHKYKIPDTSVVNKVGDCKLCLCCGWRLTAAQLVWLLNLICFLTHTAMVVITSYFAWFSKDMKALYGDDNPYSVTIYRMLAEWSNSSTQTYVYTMEDNGMPVDIAWMTVSFFGISAIFHLFAVLVGLFESTWFWYWRQMDDAFCWWR